MQVRTGPRARIPVALIAIGLLVGAMLMAPQASGQGRQVPVETARIRAAAGNASAMAPSRSNGSRVITNPAAPRYDVIALRVEFQPDTTRFTTGDGTFGGSLYGQGLEPAIDPLPHDADYFEAHLTFLRNYVEDVSNGRTHLVTHLLPNVVRLSGAMGDYSPTGPESASDAELAKLAGLVFESWRLADANISFDASGFDPDRTAFLILHAGVGRDIELLGTTLDKTPQDLPSIFLDAGALERLRPGESAFFAGLPVAHGLLVPRTQTRRGVDFIRDEPFLAEFSMNGMLAASFFNFLGVPDLFDTATGQSAIGPFGLMDGQGIFALSGLFPPQPSAWTRVFLGWEDPREIQTGDGQVSIESAGSSDPGGVARAWISPSEYFLIENRNRDPELDGVVMQVWLNGAVSEVRFAGNDETFNPFSVSGFPGGIVLSVDQWDFALPGGVDEDDVPLIGGALVWHVDERRLAAGLLSNSVNANPAARAIDLEEADSAQDIGFPSGGFFGPQFELGSPFDFWYEGNPVSVLTSSGREVRLYQNRFGADTHPSSLNNDGGVSLVELYDFSVPGSPMTFRYRHLEEDGLALEVGQSGGVTDLDPAGGDRAMAVPETAQRMGAFGGPETGQFRYVTVEDGIGTVRAEALLDAEPAVGGGAVWVASPSAIIRLETGAGEDQVALIEPGRVTGATTQIARGSDGSIYFAGTGNSGAVLVHFDGTSVSYLPSNEPILGLVLVDGEAPALLTSNAFSAESNTWSIPALSAIRGRPVGGRDRAGLVFAVSDAESSQLHLLLPGGATRSLDTDGLFGSTGGPLSRPALADLDGDGLLDVLFSKGASIWALSRGGAVVDGFPINLSASVVGGPVPVLWNDEVGFAASLTSGAVDLRVLSDGHRSVRGFPLSAGAAAAGPPSVSAGRLAVISSESVLSTWRVDGLAPAPGAPDTPSGSSFVSPELLDPSARAAALLSAEETYNWPNPVRSGATRFRFLVTEHADIDIRVLDQAGARVDDLRAESVQPGVPGEILWPADVPNGIYYARVRATGSSGATDDQLIKVAVIR